MYIPRFKVTSVTGPVYWASYLINGDASSLSDEERAQADAFAAWVGGPIVDCDEETHFSNWSDARHIGYNLGGDVATYTAHVDLTDAEYAAEEEVDPMYQQYAATALWSTNDNADDSGGEPLDANHDASDLDWRAVDRMRADCIAFLAANREDIGGRLSDAGHDFWLTRNRHGAGFWDGDWSPEVGKRLTDAAQAFGEVDLYIGDDGKICQS